MSTVLTTLIRDRILERHVGVALAKFRGQGDYTFLFEENDEVIRFCAGAGPAYTNPRIESAITFLQDIHLLDSGGVTSLGRSALNSL
jgi:hypothetical protein